MKRASCMCGEDLTDGKVMMEHLVKHPSHRQVLVQTDGKLWMNYITAIYPDKMTVDTVVHEVRIKKVRSGA